MMTTPPRSKPRLLFVTGGIHFPPTSGFSRRVLGLLKGYLARFEVAIVCGRVSAPDPMLFDRWLRDNMIGSWMLGLGTPEGSRRSLRYVLPHLPIAAAELETSAYRQALAGALASHGPFDIIHIERLPLVEAVKPMLAERRRRTLLALDLDDWESKARLRLQAATPEPNALRRIKRSIEPRRLRRYERKYLGRFDRVLVCSSADCAELRATLGLDNVLVVPNGYEPVSAELPERATAPGIPTIGFVGTLDYHPNFAAVEFFVRDVFPAIRQAVPDARFVVAGAGARRHLSSLDRMGAVSFLGFVRSLPEFYAGVDLVVAPILSGGGTRVKILEAAAFRKPTVATRIGVEGLNFVDEEEIMIRDSALGMAQSCITLLQREDIRRRLAERAHARLLAEYRWDDIGRRLAENMIASLGPSEIRGAGAAPADR